MQLRNGVCYKSDVMDGVNSNPNPKSKLITNAPPITDLEAANILLMIRYLDEDVCHNNLRRSTRVRKIPVRYN